MVSAVSYSMEAKALEGLVRTQVAARVAKEGLTVGTKAYSAAVMSEIVAQGELNAATLLGASKRLAVAQLELDARAAMLVQQKAVLAAAEAELVLSNAGTSSLSKKVVMENLKAASIAKNTAATNVKIATDKVDFLTTQKNIAATTASSFATKVNTASKTANITQD